MVFRNSSAAHRTRPQSHEVLGELRVQRRQASLCSLLCVLSFLSFGTATSHAGFLTAPSYGVGRDPRSVAVGDFNGDGILDLAVANYLDGTVSILLGNGDGTFQAAQSYAAGSGAVSVAVGDFNGDGHLDLVVANAGDINNHWAGGGVSALLGNGDGTFQVAQNYTAGTSPQSVAVGDFNGDGVPDFAMASFEPEPHNGTVSIFLGNGDGTFQTAQNYAAGNDLSSVAVGDFNGDGHPDLAVGSGGSSARVAILLGNGDGTFQAPQNYAAGGSNPVFVAAGDFNGDGTSDLAVALYDGAVSVLLSNGDGTFRPAQTYSLGSLSSGAGSALSVAIGDFNGDGKPDLAVAGVAGVNILLGNGDGTFQLSQRYAAGSGPSCVAVGDFNADGLLDLAVSNVSNFASVTIMLGKGGGAFQAPPGYAAPGRSVAMGDFNGDGHLDLAVPNGYLDTVSILLGNGDGSFQAAQEYSSGGGDYAAVVVVADLNGDGFPDLAVTNSEGTGAVSILLGNGDGTFRAGQNYMAGGGGPGSVAIGDFNGDGFPDLAVANIVGTVSILLGNGDGTFQTGQDSAAGSYPVSVAVGDINRDGILDLAVANQASGTVSILLGKGNGTFQAAQNYALGSRPQSVAIGDFNGDGTSDLAVVNDDGTVSICLGNGDGTFQAPQSYAVPGSFAYAYYAGSYLAVADFNGDGISDLAVANTSMGVSILLGNGDGTFQAAQNYAAGSSPQSVGVGDFNGDGLPDLAAVGAGGVTVLLNDGHWGP